MPTVFDLSDFENIPRRRRGDLLTIFGECETLNNNQSQIGKNEIVNLLAAVRDHEVAYAQTPLPHPIGHNRISSDYSQRWMSGFTSTFNLYIRDFGNYEDALNLYIAYVKHNPPPSVADIRQRGTMVDQLIALEKAGFNAEALGRREAHWQIRRLLQLYFGRYSFDRWGTARGRPDASSMAPDLASFRRRANIKATMQKHPKEIDLLAAMALYLSSLDQKMATSSTDGLLAWSKLSLPLYTTEIYLIPGLHIVADMQTYIKYRYQGDQDRALFRLLNDASTWQDKVAHGGEEFREALEESRERHRLASLGNGTLCLLNTWRGRTYIGDGLNISRGLRNVLQMPQAPDVYPPEIIRRNWKPVKRLWAAQAAERAAEQKTPPKTTREKREARIATAIRRRSEAQKEFEIRQHELNEDTRQSKEKRAAQRRLDTAKRHMALAIQREQKILAQQLKAAKAATTREETRDAARLAREKALRAGEQRRRQAESDAEAQRQAAQQNVSAPRQLSPEEEKQKLLDRALRSQERKKAKSESRRLRISLWRPNRKRGNKPPEGYQPS